MVMVTHDHIRMEEPLALSTYLKKCFLKSLGASLLKDLFAVVAPAEHVVNRSRKFQSPFSVPSPSDPLLVCQTQHVYSRTDPFPRKITASVRVTDIQKSIRGIWE